MVNQLFILNNRHYIYRIKLALRKWFYNVSGHISDQYFGIHFEATFHFTAFDLDTTVFLRILDSLITPLYLPVFLSAMEIPLLGVRPHALLITLLQFE